MKFKKLYAAGLCMVFLITGFILGADEIGAADNSPGSNADPLVTQSYVDKVLDEKIKPLEQEVKSLQDRVNQLKEEISKLQKTGVPSPSTNASDGTQNLGTAIIAEESGAFLRMEPSTTSNKLDTLSYGTEVRLLKESKGWFQVRTSSGNTGWVFGELLDRGN